MGKPCIYESHPPPAPRQHLKQIRARPSEPVHESHEQQHTNHTDETTSISQLSTISSQPSKSWLASSTSTPASTFTSEPPNREVESIKDQIKELEKQLARARIQKPIQDSPPFPDPRTNTIPSKLDRLCYLAGRSLLGQIQFMNRTVAHKPRLFGTSHCINGAAMVSRCTLNQPLMKKDEA
jgi:hypothetical protein